MYFVGDFSDVVGILSLLFLLFLMFYGVYKLTVYTENKKENEKLEREKDSVFYFEPADVVGVRSGSGWIYYSKKTGEPLGAKGYYNVGDWTTREEFIDVFIDELKDIQEEHIKKTISDEDRIYSGNIFDAVNALSTNILCEDKAEAMHILDEIDFAIDEKIEENTKRYKNPDERNAFLEDAASIIEDIYDVTSYMPCEGGIWDKHTPFVYGEPNEIPEKINKVKDIINEYQRRWKGLKNFRVNLEKPNDNNI